MLYAEILNMTKEYVKQADDCLETLARLKTVLFPIVSEIRQQENKEDKNGNQSHTG